jgi:hypothetical protein
MDYKVDELAKQISSIKKAASKLKQSSQGIPAVDCNVDRILSSIKMLEINISDISEL